MLNIKRISTDKEINSSILRERYRRGTRPQSQVFTILSDDIEAGFLIYDAMYDSSGLIWEIFVLSDFRNRGIGNWILSKAEAIGAELGHTKIRLEARSLDWNVRTHEELAWWYESKGYIRSSTNSDTLEKKL